MGSDKKAVLTLVAKSTVGASAQETFKLIAHLPDQTWNSFTPRIKPSQSPSTSSSDHEPPEYPIGTKITLKVGVILPIPIYQREKISIWETRSRKIAWKQNVLPDWLLETDRVQSVHPILDDTGNETCEYVTEMTFFGPLAYLVKHLMSSRIQKALETCAKDVSIEMHNRNH